MVKKIVLLGDCNVGKTAFVKKHLTNEFINDYVPTNGIIVNRLTFNTSDGKISFDVWDFPGEEQYPGLYKDYFQDADAAIIMFSLASKDSLKNVLKWYNEFITHSENIPVIIVGNKYDIKKDGVFGEEVLIKFNPLFIADIKLISVKTCYRIEDPFLALAKKFCSKSDLTFIVSEIEVPDEDKEFKKEILLELIKTMERIIKSL